MKKVIGRSLAAMMVLALPQVLGANDSGTTTEDTTTVTNQSTVNNIIVDQLKSTTIEQSVEQQSQKEQRSRAMSGYAGAQYIYGDNIQIFNIPVGLDVGYGVGVEANVPVVFVKQKVSGTGQNEKGLGDISAGLYYHFGTPSGSGLSIVSVLYKSTTGDDKKGLGSGADAYSVSYKYAKRIAGKYTLHALGSYTINNDKDPDQFGGTLGYGDSYMAMIGGSMPCLLNSKVTTSAKLTYFHADDNTYTAPGVNNKSGKTDTTDLWIQWDSTKLVSGVPLGLGVKIPLQNKINSFGTTVHPDKTFSFYLSVAGLF